MINYLNHNRYLTWKFIVLFKLNRNSYSVLSTTVPAFASLSRFMLFDTAISLSKYVFASIFTFKRSGKMERTDTRSVFNVTFPHSNQHGIGHVRYINIPTWLRGFQVKLLYLVLFLSYVSLLWELRDKRNLKNLQFWPESLGAMLEYWYIERGLLMVKGRRHDGIVDQI